LRPGRPAKRDVTTTNTDFLALAKYLSCPVVMVTAVNKGLRHVMIGTAAYASLNPLVLLTSIHNASHTGGAIMKCQRFGLSIASHEQLEFIRELSDLEGQGFTEADGDKFEHLGVEPQSFRETGTLYLTDSLASFDCELIKSMECMSYIVMLGLVQRTASGAGVRPLIRYDRSYGHFAATIVGGDNYTL